MSEIKKIVHVGDMHGNTLKLLLHLKNLGIIEMPYTIYRRCVILYLKSKDLTFDAAYDFLVLLNTLKFNPTNINNTDIIFIGDILADRGTNDFLTLMVLNLMYVKKVSFKILFSNHDAKLIYNIFNINKGEYSKLNSFNLYEEHFCSFINLKDFMIREKQSSSFAVLHAAMKEYIKNYLRHLVLVDYSYSFESNKYYFATHAPMSKKLILELADSIYKRPFSLLNSIFFMPFEIRQINYMFKKYFIKELIEKGVSEEYRETYNNISDKLEFYNSFVWNRIFDSSLLAGKEKSANHNINQVSLDGSFVDEDRSFFASFRQVIFVHGHDGCGHINYPGQEINLDNFTGKLFKNLSYNIDLSREQLHYYGMKYSDNNLMRDLEYVNAKINKLDVLGLGASFNIEFIKLFAGDIDIDFETKKSIKLYRPLLESIDYKIGQLYLALLSNFSKFKFGRILNNQRRENLHKYFDGYRDMFLVLSLNALLKSDLLLLQDSLCTLELKLIEVLQLDRERYGCMGPFYRVIKENIRERISVNYDSDSKYHLFKEGSRDKEASSFHENSFTKSSLMVIKNREEVVDEASNFLSASK